LVEKAPAENIYAIQMLTAFPMPFCSYPCGVKCKKVRATVDVACADGENRNTRVRAEWMNPDDFDPDGKVVLYFHGGAFIIVTEKCERFHTGLLAKYFGCRILSCEYPRPPKSPYPEPVDASYAAWKWLTKEEGVDPSKVIISGDSAGGNLAISLTRRLKSEGEKPGGLLLFSPWVEMVPFPCKSWESNKDLDFIAVKGLLHTLVDLYVDQEDPKSVNVSPLRADVQEFEGWPPVWISVGGVEVLRSSIMDFYAKLKEANVTTEIYTGKGMPHVYQLFALGTQAPEAKLQPCMTRCLCGGLCCWGTCGFCGCCSEEPDHPIWKSMEEAQKFIQGLA